MATAIFSKKMSGEAKAVIAQVVRDVLEDPDFGRVLSGRAEARLRKAKGSKQKTVPFAAIKRTYLS
ncbi:MAG: hypothetical protein NUV61_00355 [Candidatus Azambacteria bacterium]|nr:hypothetical protein [Candidatus Azambacteria bacterium]